MNIQLLDEVSIPVILQEWWVSLVGVAIALFGLVLFTVVLRTAVLPAVSIPEGFLRWSVQSALTGW
jgi:hypothetical protein